MNGNVVGFNEYKTSISKKRVYATNLRRRLINLQLKNNDFQTTLSNVIPVHQNQKIYLVSSKSLLITTMPVAYIYLSSAFMPEIGRRAPHKVVYEAEVTTVTFKRRDGHS